MTRRAPATPGTQLMLHAGLPRYCTQADRPGRLEHPHMSCPPLCTLRCKYDLRASSIPFLCTPKACTLCRTTFCRPNWGLMSQMITSDVGDFRPDKTGPNSLPKQNAGPPSLHDNTNHSTRNSARPMDQKGGMVLHREFLTARMYQGWGQ